MTTRFNIEKWGLFVSKLDLRKLGKNLNKIIKSGIYFNKNNIKMVEFEKREFKVFKDAAENEITKLKKSREALRNALEFYGNGEHLNHNDHEIVELECEGSTMTDHIAGKKAREALKDDDEIMKGK